MRVCIMLPELCIQWIFKYNFIGIRDLQVLRTLCLPQFIVFQQNFLLIHMTTLMNAFLFRFSDFVEALKLSCPTQLHTMRDTTIESFTTNIRTLIIYPREEGIEISIQRKGLPDPKQMLVVYHEQQKAQHSELEGLLF
ncbi:hypothetical protein MTR_6g464750 [Medicago truncatula]|uniref:Uncharacterized protein n=1 Tax=Medicago truncatula TaxID=3880 RepID=A0A072U9T6_MEDTR|nr:hypothetical protein MTR_6g464750 [Medicago truncatula]